MSQRLHHLEIFWRRGGVVLLVEPGGIDGSTHPQDIQLVLEFWCHFRRLHVEPVRALSLLTLGLLELLQFPLANLQLDRLDLEIKEVCNVTLALQKVKQYPKLQGSTTAIQ